METRLSELGTDSIASYVIATTYLKNEASWGQSLAWAAHIQVGIYWMMVPILPASAFCLLVAGAVGRHMSTVELLALLLPLGLAASAYAEKVRRTVGPSVSVARSRLDKSRRSRLDRLQLLAEVAYLAFSIAAMMGAREFYFRATG